MADVDAIPVAPCLLHDDLLILAQGPHLRLINAVTLELIWERLNICGGSGIVDISHHLQGPDHDFYIISGDDRTLQTVRSSDGETVLVQQLKNRVAGLGCLPFEGNPSGILDQNLTKMVFVDKFGDVFPSSMSTMQLLSDKEKLRCFRAAKRNPKDSHMLQRVREILGKTSETPYVELPIDAAIEICLKVISEHPNMGTVEDEDEDGDELDQFSKGSNGLMSMCVRYRQCNKMNLGAVADKDEKVLILPLDRLYDTHGYCLGHARFVSDMAFVEGRKNEALLATVSADMTLGLWDLTDQCRRIATISLPTMASYTSIPCSIAVQKISDDRLVALVGYTGGELGEVMVLLSKPESASVRAIPLQGTSIQNDQAIQSLQLTSISLTNQHRPQWEVAIVYATGKVAVLTSSSGSADGEDRLEVKKVFIPEVTCAPITGDFIKPMHAKGALTNADRKAKRERDRQKHLELQKSPCGPPKKKSKKDAHSTVADHLIG